MNQVRERMPALSVRGARARSFRAPPKASLGAIAFISSQQHSAATAKAAAKAKAAARDE